MDTQSAGRNWKWGTAGGPGGSRKLLSREGGTVETQLQQGRFYLLRGPGPEPAARPSISLCLYCCLYSYLSASFLVYLTVSIFFLSYLHFFHFYIVFSFFPPFFVFFPSPPLPSVVDHLGARPFQARGPGPGPIGPLGKTGLDHMDMDLTAMM